MTNAVHVVAVGARCVVGLSAESAAAAIRARISRVAEDPVITDCTGEKVLCARDSRIDRSCAVPDRITLLAEHTLTEIVSKLSATHPAGLPVRVLLALPEPRPGFSKSDAASVKRTLSARTAPNGATVGVEQVGEGHAGALSALRMAIERVASGHDDVCVAGGADSYIDAPTIAWLDADRRLARSGIRAGFRPGEGAAMIALATDAGCRRIGLPSLARVRAVACFHEQRSSTSDEETFGEALTKAVVEATQSLRLPEDLIDDVYGDINGERTRTEDWGFTLMRTGVRFRDGTDYVSSVGECGDLGAATAALGCVLAVQSWRRRYANGSRALVWAGSWGGLRGAAVLEDSLEHSFWDKTRKPLLPDDYDERFALAAPDDQRPRKPLRGGEVITLVNMTREGLLRFELPKIFLAFSTTVSGRTEQHRATLATVFVAPELMRLTLVWQSRLKVAGRDVEYVDFTTITEKPFIA